MERWWLARYRSSQLHGFDRPWRKVFLFGGENFGLVGFYRRVRLTSLYNRIPVATVTIVM